MKTGCDLLPKCEGIQHVVAIMFAFFAAVVPLRNVGVYSVNPVVDKTVQLWFPCEMQGHTAIEVN